MIFRPLDAVLWFNQVRETAERLQHSAREPVGLTWGQVILYACDSPLPHKCGAGMRRRAGVTLVEMLIAVSLVISFFLMT